MEQTKAAMQNMKPRRETFGSDLIAGLTFAVVNVPQAMAHALLATVNPVFGIFTLMIAVPIGAIFTSSVYMNVSTTGALMVATGSGLAYTPASQRLEALVVLVLLVGVIQMLAGLFRLGFLLRFVSNAVMTGFLNGVAVLIILGQLGDLTGFNSLFSNSLLRSIELVFRINTINVPTTIIGLLTLGGMVALLYSPLRKFAFIIAILAATVLLALLSLPGMPTSVYFNSVKTVGEVASIPRALPSLVFPKPALILSMLFPAFSVALIGLIQGAGVSQGYPNPDGKYPNVSRDFFGQGLANIATSFVGGVPAGGSISGTALLMGAGARTRLANISSGFFVAMIVLLIAPLVELVPMPALAALLIVAGFQGLRLQDAMTVWQTGRVSAVVMVMTFIATLFIPLQYAVLLGMVLSIVLHVFRQSNKVEVTQWVLKKEGFPVERPVPKNLPSHKLTIMHVYGSLFFAAAKNIEEVLPSVEKTRHAVAAISLRGQGEIGSTFVAVLQRYAEALHSRNSLLMLIGVDSTTINQLSKTGILQLIGEENVFPATPQLGEAMNNAVDAADAWLARHAESEKSEGASITRQKDAASPSADTNEDRD